MVHAIESDVVTGIMCALKFSVSIQHVAFEYIHTKNGTVHLEIIQFCVFMLIYGISTWKWIQSINGDSGEEERIERQNSTFCT